ncbi:class I SAM-dependent methyltransferase [Dyadobacter subterraneus]|uniref:Methyltransferase domain-containing protein n=1 Tax=Dyadobacter subterraneus TaxID=2773304 RepID=A0ABR9WHN2_9BACT|nr:methyltransferase domain-containing protein [Dyadobacter subterraneus]MBE9465023.1 hypothetical protein [Dyadobacter subterraneus]
MLPNESQWISSTIKGCFPDKKMSILNVGSSTLEFRTVLQPYVNDVIFKPLTSSGFSVTHLDMKQDEGVDIVGDLTNTEFRDSLRSKKYDIILCANLLEHLENPKNLCNLLYELVDTNGYILITVPYIYPYHEDPLDTLFRPKPSEIKELFPDSMKIIAEGIVKENFGLLNEPERLFKNVLKSILFFLKPKRWTKHIKDAKIVLSVYQASCILLQRVED